MEDADKALEAHAGVHAGRGQVGARAVQVVVELHEHQVPQLDIAVADNAVRHDIGAVWGRIVSQAAVFRAVVVVEFAAGSAWSFVAGRGPTSFVVAIAINLVGGDALGNPEVAGVFVGVMHCRGELFERDAVALGHKLNGEIDRAALEVVAEAEVAEHLEERVVRGVATSSMSGVRKHFCEVVARLLDGSASPVKYGLNCTMPALVSRQRRVADRNQR